MATITVTETLKRRIESQVQATGSSSVADYIDALIDTAMREREIILTALRDGEDSGVSDETPESILEDLLRARLAA